MTDQTSFDDELPILTSGIGDESPICGECEHPAIIGPRKQPGLRRLLGMRPRAAECQVLGYDVSGLAAIECGCRNAVHGS